MYELSFSQRNGLTPESKDIQLKSMDDDLKNGIWNGLRLSIFDPLIEKNNFRARKYAVKKKFQTIWDGFLKQKTDELNNHIINQWINNLRDKFDDFQWNEVYDFVEFILKMDILDKTNVKKFVKCMNDVLEREFSGYRIIGKQITPITNPMEIEEISKASNTVLQEVNTHFERALAFLSDKDNPDPRNSIKESISAVEVLCKKIIGDPNATLGAALTQLKETKKIIGDPNATLGAALTQLKETKKITLHPSMEEAIKQLYHYTNDASGIRHALEEEKIAANFDDAKFMIVCCSAFVNYLIAKSNDAEIDLS